MRRDRDVDYLEQLLRESRHLEVRNAAQAQLRLLKEAARRQADHAERGATAQPPGVAAHEGPHLAGDARDVLERQLGVERQAQHLPRELLRDGQVARPSRPPAPSAGWRWIGPRVVDRGRDPARPEVLRERVPLRPPGSCRGARPSARPPAPGARRRRARRRGPLVVRGRALRPLRVPRARGGAASRAGSPPAGCRAGCSCRARRCRSGARPPRGSRSGAPARAKRRRPTTSPSRRRRRPRGSCVG